MFHGPVEVRIVCGWPPLYEFLEDLAFSIIESFLFPEAYEFKGEYTNQEVSPKKRDSGHYAYPRDKRLMIVMHFRRDREMGKVYGKNTWARNNYNISGRTLKNYEDEFPVET